MNRFVSEKTNDLLNKINLCLLALWKYKKNKKFPKVFFCKSDQFSGRLFLIDDFFSRKKRKIFMILKFESRESSWNWIENLEFQRVEQLYLPSWNRQKVVNSSWNLEFQRAEQLFLPSWNRSKVVKSSWNCRFQLCKNGCCALWDSKFVIQFHKFFTTLDRFQLGKKGCCALRNSKFSISKVVKSSWNWIKI